MIVKSRVSKTNMPVFAIYEIEGTLRCSCLPPNNGGLVSYDMKDVEVIDPAIWGKWIYHYDNGFGFYHHSLIEEGLLDPLQEYDDAAYERFLGIIKAEGLVKPDFY